jgi:serine/threonine-protein kinase
MNGQHAGMDDVVIRLSPGVVFTVDHDGRPRAEIARGASTTRFAIDADIQTFLECFRQPLTLQEAAAALAPQGFAPDNVLQFGKAMLKTPLLEFHDDTMTVPHAGAILAAAGMELVTAFKDRKFDGVYHVRQAQQVDEDAGRDRIVKLLRAPAQLGVAQRVLRRMENEYAVLKRLDAVPAVVKAGRFIASPHPCFDMEYIEGSTLTDLVMTPCGSARRIAIAHEAVAALAGIHACGVIHGDLHTSNFLLDTAGRLRVIDFDCSFVHGGGYVPRVGGAVHFMPPERMTDDWHTRREVEPDFASDIYQLGIILYFVLKGVPPFRGSQYAALAGAIRRGEYAPLTHTREGDPLPAELCRAVEDCMAYDPARRPASLAGVLPIFAASAKEHSHP